MHLNMITIQYPAMSHPFAPGWVRGWLRKFRVKLSSDASSGLSGFTLPDHLVDFSPGLALKVLQLKTMGLFLKWETDNNSYVKIEKWSDFQQLDVGLTLFLIGLGSQLADSSPTNRTTTNIRKDVTEKNFIFVTSSFLGLALVINSNNGCYWRWMLYQLGF